MSKKNATCVGFFFTDIRSNARVNYRRVFDVRGWIPTPLIMYYCRGQQTTQSKKRVCWPTTLFLTPHRQKNKKDLCLLTASPPEWVRECLDSACGPSLLVGNQIGFCLVFSFFAKIWTAKSGIKFIVSAECIAHSSNQSKGSLCNESYPCQLCDMSRESQQQFFSV